MRVSSRQESALSATAASNGAGDVAAPSVLEVEGLGKRYGDFWAVRDVSFTVRRGEIFGLIGANGAGKSTTLKTIAGLIEPTEGSVRVGGERADDPAVRQRVGYLPEESPLYDDMTARTYLRFFGELYGMDKNVARPRIESLLDGLRLDYRDRKIGDLSKGMRRKIAIARSLLHDPDVLLYDEPASGLDPVMSAHVLDIIQGMRAAGRTVIFSAHNLYHVERICDRVLILAKGKQAAIGSMDELRADSGGTRYRVRSSVPLDGATEAPDHSYEIMVASFDEVAALEKAATARGGRLLDVRSVEIALEEVFLKAQS